MDEQVNQPQSRVNFKIISIIVGVIAVVLALAFYFYTNEEPSENKPNNTNVSTTTINIGGIDVEVTGPNAGSIKIEPVGDVPPAPSLNRKITYSEAFSSEAQKIMNQKFVDLRARLNKSSLDTDAWIELGLRYKQVGDYQGAKEAWEYVSILSPKNIVSFNNLGDLYHYHLQEYPLAEKNFLQAIKNDPKYTLSYINLHDLYRLSYGILTTKATDILKQGIVANPNAIDLYIALATYYKNMNNKIDIANARTYYEQALTKAKALNNQNLVNAITAELNALK